MASSFSSSSRATWKYRVFTSFHGPDVRKTLISHLRKQFSYNGISMFDDQGIERSEIIAHALKEAIRESRISIVVLSKNYASSSWCLDELVDIFKCKENIVMTIFYEVDPSDVRKQTGEFGSIFEKTCLSKTKGERQSWSKALEDVANIAGEHFKNWDNESNMIEKIAKDVSNKLNATISWDFGDIVGIEAHLHRMLSLLNFAYKDGAVIVGICGPAGIGKTTIARALHSRLSSNFQLNYFMENIRGSNNSGLDKYGLKLRLQKQLLSEITNQDGTRIYNLNVLPSRLCDQKVLIILDDVDNLEQLKALANETSWFGPGSRIIITTEDQWLLNQADINSIYHVDFPSKEEACKIFYKYAFRGGYAPYGFEKLAERVTELCSNLPLGLRVMGSILYRNTKDYWEGIIHRLENGLEGDIDEVLKVGYNQLNKDDQLIFNFIAIFFNGMEVDHVIAILADTELDVKQKVGLKNLADKSLIQKSTEGKIVMHKLLQQVGRQAVQSQEPWKRQILIDSHEICDVLETESGSRRVMGISLDISTIVDSVQISSRAFKKMPNLGFLRVYETGFDRKDGVHVPQVDRNKSVIVPEDMDFPPRLRLLHWEVYPGKCLPPTFNPEYLVELNLRENNLEKLWQGIQSLPKLKKMDLFRSKNLKELPDLSNAENLEYLRVTNCWSLEELPHSILKLRKLERLEMEFCVKLKVVPTFNLASLHQVNMWGCWQLKNIPDISTNIKELSIAETMLGDISRDSIRLCGVKSLSIIGSLLRFGHVKKLPDWIKDLHQLENLYIGKCPKLASLPELPASLNTLKVDSCESLETIISVETLRFRIPHIPSFLYFSNCFKLDQTARTVITNKSLEAYLPGGTIPATFDQQALGNSLTIRSDFNLFEICAVVSPKQQMDESGIHILCDIRINGCPIKKKISHDISKIQKDHLYISNVDVSDEDEGWRKQDSNEILFEFSTTSPEVHIIECGICDRRAHKPISSYESSSEKLCEDDDESLSNLKNSAPVSQTVEWTVSSRLRKKNQTTIGVAEKKKRSKAEKGKDMAPYELEVEFDAKRFSSLAAQNRFEILRNNKFIEEIEVDFCEGDSIKSLIENAGMLGTVTGLQPCVDVVLWEFWANLASVKVDSDSVKVLVRNWVYEFSPEKINKMFGLPHVDERTHIVHIARVLEDEVAGFMTGGKVNKWKDIKNGIFTDENKLMYKICCSNWLPTSNNAHPQLSQAKLIYMMKHNLQFNFGKLVFDHVMQLRLNPESKLHLPFPSLVYQLLMAQHPVEFEQDDPIVKKKKKIAKISKEDVAQTSKKTVAKTLEQDVSRASVFKKGAIGNREAMLMAIQILMQALTASRGDDLKDDMGDNSEDVGAIGPLDMLDFMQSLVPKEDDSKDAIGDDSEDVSSASMFKKGAIGNHEAMLMAIQILMHALEANIGAIGLLDMLVLMQSLAAKGDDSNYDKGDVSEDHGGE